MVNEIDYGVVTAIADRTLDDVRAMMQKSSQEPVVQKALAWCVLDQVVEQIGPRVSLLLSEHAR